MTKRIFDLLFSFIGLMVLSPLLFVIGLLVITDSRGGVLYLQNRVGKGNKNFKLYKFRTMYNDSDKKGLLTVGNRDSRITRIGYFLRKYKLDELPQLINVLIGNMSFVGPRPEVRKYVNLYNNEQLKVLKVKPGITDYASIEFRNENELLNMAENPEDFYVNYIMPQKLNINLQYLQNNSLVKDISIIITTLYTIIGK